MSIATRPAAAKSTHLDELKVRKIWSVCAGNAAGETTDYETAADNSDSEQGYAVGLHTVDVCAVTLSGCVDENGKLSSAANDLMSLDSYTERDGNSVRVLMLGDLNTAEFFRTAPQGLQFQSTGRIPFTGDHVARSPLRLFRRQSDLEQLYGIPRPEIKVDGDDIANQTPPAWGAIRKTNTPPTIFRAGGVPSRIESDDDDAPVVRALTLDRMRNELASRANFVKDIRVPRIGGARGEKTAIRISVTPPEKVVKNVLATADPPLPVLKRIVEAPVCAADGSVSLDPGYCEKAKTFFAPSAGFKIPPVSESPSAAELAQAVSLVADDLLGDFPFTGAAEKAHAIACFLGVFVREIVSGPTPLHLFEAPLCGTGKTLLVNILLHPASGRLLSPLSEGSDEDEWRKRIFSKLRSAPAAVLIDNLTLPLGSAALCSAITSYPAFEDRVLGFSETARVPVKCVWIATGNNPVLSLEVARRTVRIRLNAETEHPWLRTKFKHPDLRGWVIANRARLVWAALTMVKAWVSAGRPDGPRTLGMFESWSRTIGGILSVAGVSGFLGNLENLYDTADDAGAHWREFLSRWWAEYKDATV